MTYENHEVVGFDIRLCAEDYVDKRWDKKNRDLLLLKPEITWPLSVDEWIWPSVFILSQKEALQARVGYFPEYLPFQGVIKADPTNFRHQITALWTNFEEMKICYFENAKKKEKLPQQAIPIAVELITNEPFTSYEYWHGALFPSLNIQIPANWVFLGYDIADDGFESGLYSRGYEQNEKRLLQKTWITRFNEYGLIKDFKDVTEFKELTDKRIPEHAPFYIFGLWRAPKTLTR